MSEALARTDSVNHKLQRDLNVLVKFVELYCRDHHPAESRKRLLLRTHNVAELEARDVHVCPACAKLLQHGMVKRANCTMSPKPACKRCPRHCYAPVYRQQMKDVMRYSGRKLVLMGRLDYLWHLLF